MKKILFATLGLMSLLGLSSCDDTSTFNETEEFEPYGYIVKDAETIQVLGKKNLVIGETSKTDWGLYVQERITFFGDAPLKITDEDGDVELFDIDGNSGQIDIETNMVDIKLNNGETQEQVLSIAVSGLKYQYMYMGKTVDLICLYPFKVRVQIISNNVQDSPFNQMGEVRYSLMTTANNIVLAEKTTPFEVINADYFMEKYSQKIEIAEDISESKQ